MAMSEPVREIYTDDQIKAYEGYIPDDWGQRVIGPLPERTVLERLALDLGLAWRSASYTAQMPVTSIRAMHAAAIGRASLFSKNSTIAEFADRAIGKLADRMPGLHAN